MKSITKNNLTHYSYLKKLNLILIKKKKTIPLYLVWLTQRTGYVIAKTNYMKSKTFNHLYYKLNIFLYSLLIKYVNFYKKEKLRFKKRWLWKSTKKTKNKIKFLYLLVSRKKTRKKFVRQYRCKFKAIKTRFVGKEKYQKIIQLRLKNYLTYSYIFKKFFKTFYGLKEKELKTLCLRFFKKKAKINKLITFLETRLDIALFRLNFIPNLKLGRLWIKKGLVTVNNKIITQIKYTLKVNDVIRIDESLFLFLKHYIKFKKDMKLRIAPNYFKKMPLLLYKGGVCKDTFFQSKNYNYLSSICLNSYYFLYKLPPNFVINFNTFSAILIDKNIKLKNLPLPKFFLKTLNYGLFQKVFFHYHK